MVALASPRLALSRFLAHRGTRCYSSNSAIHLPTPTPDSGHVQLVNRSIIQLTGADTTQFLQGLVTQNLRNDKIEGLTATSESAGSGAALRKRLFTAAFLNVRGRLRNDAFLLRFPHVEKNGEASVGYYIDIDKEGEDEFMRYLKKLKLRSKVAISKQPPESLSVFAAWDCSPEAIWHKFKSETWESPKAGFEDRNLGITQSFVDTRAPSLGWRVYGAPEKILADERMPGKREQLSAWQLRRYLCGVAEGQRELFFDSALPMDSNLDIAGGVCFTKGCYVGQELTIRTHHRGVVRKRILPIQLFGNKDDVSASHEQDMPVYHSPPNPAASAGSFPEPGSPLTLDSASPKTRPTGEYLAGTGNVGLALCKLDVMTDLDVYGTMSRFSPENKFVLKRPNSSSLASDASTDEKLYVRSFVPPWVRQFIQMDNSRRTSS